MPERRREIKSLLPGLTQKAREALAEERRGNEVERRERERGFQLDRERWLGSALTRHLGIVVEDLSECAYNTELGLFGFVRLEGDLYAGWEGWSDGALKLCRTCLNCQERMAKIGTLDGRDGLVALAEILEFEKDGQAATFCRLCQIEANERAEEAEAPAPDPYQQALARSVVQGPGGNLVRVGPGQVLPAAGLAAWVYDASHRSMPGDPVVTVELFYPASEPPAETIRDYWAVGVEPFRSDIAALFGVSDEFAAALARAADRQNSLTPQLVSGTADVPLTVLEGGKASA